MKAAKICKCLKKSTMTQITGEIDRTWEDEIKTKSVFACIKTVERALFLPEEIRFIVLLKHISKTMYLYVCFNRKTKTHTAYASPFYTPSDENITTCLQLKDESEDFTDTDSDDSSDFDDPPSDF